MSKLREQIMALCWLYLWKHWPDRVYYVLGSEQGYASLTRAKVARDAFDRTMPIVERLDHGGEWHR